MTAVGLKLSAMDGQGRLRGLPGRLNDLLIVFFVIRLLHSQTPAEGRSAMRGLYLSGAPWACRRF